MESQNKFSPKEGSENGANEKGKMFIGGLSWETSRDNLLRYFSQYGEVVDCVVMKNPETGRSRGFGFITFADPNNVDLVLQNTPHILDNRTIDPKPCNPRAEMTRAPRRPVGSGNGYKVFLGGLPSNLTETDLRNFFSQYGKVTEVVIMYDQEKKKSRGFGFLTFESEESVDRCTGEHYVSINGKQVEIKKAEPRDTRGSSGGMRRGGHNGGWDGPGMGMHGGMGGPMGGPMGPPMGPPMGGYQGWGGPGPANTGYGYGPQSGYQGWGPQSQWGGYGGGPSGNYGYEGPQGGPQGYNNWNWGGPQGGPGPNGDMYGRGPSTANGGPPGAAAPSGPGVPGVKAEATQYGAGYATNGYGSEVNQGYRGGYPQDTSAQGYGGQVGYGNPERVPPPGVAPTGNGLGVAGTGAASGGPPGGPGPQRGTHHHQPSQSQYHPYRRGV